jgi:hypothetical protein
LLTFEAQGIGLIFWFSIWQYDSGPIASMTGAPNDLTLRAATSPSVSDPQ